MIDPWEVAGVRGHLFGPVVVSEEQVVKRCCDFVVREVLTPREGETPLFLLVKELEDTLSAVREVSREFCCRGFTVAGLKDKVALTVQHVSLLGCGKARDVELFDWGLVKRTGVYAKPVRPGSHDANRFYVRVRSKEARSLYDFLVGRGQLVFPNFVGYQRFGVREPYTHVLALELVRKAAGRPSEFDEIVGAGRGWWERTYARKGFLDGRVLGLMVSALQSYYFNLCLSRALAKGSEVLGRAGVLPGWDLKTLEIRGWVSRDHYECVLEEVSSSPEVLEGLRALGFRTRLRPLTELARVLSLRLLDEETLALGFELSPGAYGTVLLRELVGDVGSVLAACEPCLRSSSPHGPPL